MAIGTVPVPALIFSIGTALYRVCVLTKIQSPTVYQKSILFHTFHTSAMDT